MTHKLIIYGRLPGMNEYTEANRRNAHAGANMKKAGQKYCERYIRAQLHGVQIKRPVFLHYRFFEKDRRRDLDNIGGFAHKVIQDALVSCKVLKNDGWRYIVGYTDLFEVDRKTPRIEVLVEEIDAVDQGADRHL